LRFWQFFEVLALSDRPSRPNYRLPIFYLAENPTVQFGRFKVVFTEISKKNSFVENARASGTSLPFEGEKLLRGFRY
jgi:hypothetical protein